MSHVILPGPVAQAWPVLSPKAKAVAVALAIHMDGRQHCCLDRNDLLAATGLKKAATVSAAIRELERVGLIGVSRGRNTPNTYCWSAPGVPSNGTAGYAARGNIRVQDMPPDGTAGCTVERHIQALGVPPNGPPGCAEKGNIQPPDVPLNGTPKYYSTEYSPTQLPEELPSSSVASNDAAVPPELRGLELYEKDPKLCNRWPSLLHSWRQAYKDVDILAEVTKAHAWELANPARRKKDRARFLTGWLSRTQSRIDSEARLEARRIEAELAEMEPPELPQELIDEIELRAMEAEAQRARERNK